MYICQFYEIWFQENKNLIKRNYTPKEGFLSHLGHFNPLVFEPHFLQRCSNETAAYEGVLISLTIKAITIKTPTTIPIQTRTIQNIIHCYL